MKPSLSLRESLSLLTRRRNAKVSGFLALACLAGAVVTACGGGGQTVKRPSILVADDSSKTVHLLLVSSSTNAYGGFNFDGYGDGAMRVTVPLGWRVDVTCKNASAIFSHSCAIVDAVALSPTGAALAFSGATSPDPQSGERPGNAATFSFVASRVGNYRIACLISGHEIDGMWDWLTVSRGGLPTLHTHT